MEQMLKQALSVENPMPAAEIVEQVLLQQTLWQEEAIDSFGVLWMHKSRLFLIHNESFPVYILATAVARI